MLLIDFVLPAAAIAIAIVVWNFIAWLCRGLYRTWIAFWRTPE